MVYFYFLTQNDLDISYTSPELVQSDQASDGKKTKIHEINISDDQTIKLSIIDDERFLMILPDGKKQVYEIPSDEDSKVS